jgi:hypothetical protein
MDMRKKKMGFIRRLKKSLRTKYLYLEETNY